MREKSQGKEELTFIGVDLAWNIDRNNTGIAVLRGARQDAQLVEVAKGIHSLKGVQDFLASRTTHVTFVAIDAPLIITNETGQRICENGISKKYGKREASCHSSNRRLYRRYQNTSSVALADSLLKNGYVHAPEAKEDSNKVILEVYPHAGMVALFDLPRTLKYKKGCLEQKRQGLLLLACHIRRLFAALPALHNNPYPCLEGILSRDISRLNTADLKIHEDTLDAIFCAYLAYYFWYWHMERNEVFGNIQEGYIINPKLLQGEI